MRERLEDSQEVSGKLVWGPQSNRGYEVQNGTRQKVRNEGSVNGVFRHAGGLMG